MRKFDIKNPYTEEEVKKGRKLIKIGSALALLVFSIAVFLSLSIDLGAPFQENLNNAMLYITIALLVMRIILHIFDFDHDWFKEAEEHELLARINKMTNNNDVLRYHLLVKERTPPLLEMELRELENFYEEAKKQEHINDLKNKLDARGKELEQKNIPN